MDRITYLIEKFWEGKVTEEEKKEVLQYLERHHPEQQVRMEQEFWAKESSEDDIEIARADEVFSQIQSVKGVGNAADRSSAGYIRTFARLVAAAVILGALGCGLSFYLIRDSEPIPRTASTPLWAPDTILHENIHQENLIVLLDDGSKVSLASGSSIRYLSHFEKYKRDVFLEGKATFEVTKDTLRPFTVWAAGYSTTALGTTFSVAARSKEVFKVNLVSGKVVVRSSPQSSVALSDVYLEPGEELRVNSRSGLWAVSNRLNQPISVSKKKVRSKKIEKISEEEGSDLLRFDKAPLDEVFRCIAREFDVNIDVLAREVHQLSFTGEFQPTDSLEVVLNIICNMNDLIYHKEERTIRIEKDN